MEIAFHIGANCTRADQLLKSLLRNAAMLMQRGVAIPGPGKYRALLRETIQQLDGARPPADARDILIDAIVEEDQISRIVLNNDNFVTIPKRIFHHDVFYSQAESKVRVLRRLFPEDDLSLFLGIRNPVSFLQDCCQQAEASSLRDYIGLLHPSDIYWSDVIKRIKRAAPDVTLTVWCTEDTPLIWEDLIRAQAGLDTATAINGQYDVITPILNVDGQAALRGLDPALARVARHNALADLIENHGRPEVLHEEIDMPALTPELIKDMTDGYDADLDLIDQMNGVTLMLPFR